MKLSVNTQTNFLRAALSVIAGLVLAGVLLKLSGYSPLERYQALAEGATGIRSGKPLNIADKGFYIGSWQGSFSPYTFAQTLATVSPLLFCGLAIALGLRGGLFNIGAQGQMTLGAMAAAFIGAIGANGSLEPVAGSLPRWIHAPLVLLAGAAAGGLWGALAGFLKAKRGVHEVLSTIMLNYIALNLANYLAMHNLKDPNPANMAAQTGLIAKSAWLTPLIAQSNLTIGLLLAITAAIGMAFLLWRTALGYEIRAVGLGEEAARTAGIPVSKIVVQTMALSGALAGAAGALEVMGIHHRFVQGTAGDYGFDGIAAALLGGSHPLGIVLSASFFGALSNGANFMQIQTDTPKTIAVVVQAVIVLLVGLRFRRERREKGGVNTQKTAVEAAKTEDGHGQ